MCWGSVRSRAAQSPALVERPDPLAVMELPSGRVGAQQAEWAGGAELDAENGQASR